MLASPVATLTGGDFASEVVPCTAAGTALATVENCSAIEVLIWRCSAGHHQTIWLEQDR